MHSELLMKERIFRWIIDNKHSDKFNSNKGSNNVKYRQNIKHRRLKYKAGLH